MNTRSITRPAANPNLWLLDREITFLNHGSFGACPKAVLNLQQKFRERIEREPVTFYVRELEGLLDQARAAMASFVKAPPRSVVFVPNATSGINTVLRSLRFKAGDELLVTDHEYNACRNALQFAATTASLRVRVAKIPFPLRDESEILEAITAGCSKKTRLLLVDHITSQTALVMPLKQIIDSMTERGVDVLVDGAHAPGMIPLNLRQLNPAYYTGNCHKWLCSPKTAAFLYVREDKQKEIHPLSISHGFNSSRTDRSKFLVEFGWTGTGDPSPVLTVPCALEYLGSLMDGGWPALMARNRTLALEARKVLCHALDVPLPCPDKMIGSLASVPLPDAKTVKAPKSPLYLDELQEELFARFKIEVPIIPWPAPPRRLIRISAQLYNSLPQYVRLGESLLHLLSRR